MALSFISVSPSRTYVVCYPTKDYRNFRYLRFKLPEKCDNNPAVALSYIWEKRFMESGMFYGELTITSYEDYLNIEEDK